MAAASQPILIKLQGLYLMKRGLRFEGPRRGNSQESKPKLWFRMIPNKEDLDQIEQHLTPDQAKQFINRNEWGVQIGFYLQHLRGKWDSQSDRTIFDEGSNMFVPCDRIADAFKVRDTAFNIQLELHQVETAQGTRCIAQLTCMEITQSKSESQNRTAQYPLHERGPNTSLATR